MILLIDNYDSFSYNLYQLIGSISPNIKVVRNDEISIEEIVSLAPEAIIISPGPGRPENAGICQTVVTELSSRFPILGVCLGHQAICQAHGATVAYAKTLMHGKQSNAQLNDDTIFEGCLPITPVARYHSLAVDKKTLPETLKVIATTEDGEVMAVKDKKYPVYGLQFHPESIMTPDGLKIIHNFLKLKTQK